MFVEEIRLILMRLFQVLGEISRPRQNFPISMITSVSLVGILYMAVNIAYVNTQDISVNVYY